MRNTLDRREFLKLAGLSVAASGLSGCNWIGIVEREKLAKVRIQDLEIPNVLLIVLDTVRAQNMSLYGYDRPTTPNLERLAKTGVVFERAISTAPWTLPTHASMFTGRWHHELSTEFNAGLDYTYPTLAEVLSDAGYYTGGFVANLGYCSYENGLHRGFIHYEDYPISTGAFLASSPLTRRISKNRDLRRVLNKPDLLIRKSAAEVNSNFLDWLRHHQDRPFFAFLNYYDAHIPYLPPTPYNSMFGPTNQRGDIEKPRTQWSQQEIQAEIDAYDGAITYIDSQLNFLMDELRKQDLLENTLIIITSDHGEQLGEHQLFDHVNSLFIQTLWVPLVIIFPSGVSAGDKVSLPVSLRDIPATIFELIGVGGNAFPGNPLSGYWQKESTIKPDKNGAILSEINRRGIHIEEDWHPIAKGNMKSLVVGKHHYILNGDGREELYDLEMDPSEENDIVRTVGEDVLMGIRASLESILNHG